MQQDGDGGGTGRDPRWVPETTLPMHNLTRYLRARVGVTDGVLQWAVPRTLLGVAPIGTRRLALPIEDVRSARMRRGVHPVRFLFGLACVAVPPFFTPWWVMVPLILLGIWVILVSLGPHLEVETLSGRKHRAGVCFGHQIDAELYAAAVNDLAAAAHPAAQSGPAG
jgi:hypothetical protein